MERDTDTIDGERPERLLSPTTRRSFVGRSAGAFAAVSGGGMLLAACGDDSDDAAGGGSASTSEESAGGGGDGGGEVQVVNILPPQLGYSAEYIADMDGYFKKEGLTVKVNTARGSAPAIQAVLSGTALLSWVGWLESVIAISNRGAPIQAVVVHRPAFDAEAGVGQGQPDEHAAGSRGRAHRHPVRGRDQRDDARPHDRQRGHRPQAGAAAGHRLHPGHVRAHQAQAHRRVHHRRLAGAAVPRGAAHIGVPRDREVRPGRPLLHHVAGRGRRTTRRRSRRTCGR